MTTPPPAPFIVGVARSGTTLLRFMLDCHPQLAIPAETHFITLLSQADPAGASLHIDDFLLQLTSCFTWADFGLSRDALARELANLTPFTVADGVRVFYRLCASARGKTRWGDKTPTYVEHIAAIDGFLPEAHFIHIIRDGRAVAASRRHLSFGPGPDIGDQARDWGRKIRAARKQATFCRHYMEIRYEDLVRNPEVALRNVCAEIKLDYDPSMLDYPAAAETRLREFRDWRFPSGETTLSGDYRRSIHQRTLSPLSPNRIDHWRTVLESREVATFEAVEGDLLVELGYALETRERT
jgi:hypothetical protein